MENFAVYLKLWGESLKNIWLNFNLNQKVIISGIALLFLVIIIVLSKGAGKEDPYQVLYAELDEKDAAAVVEKLAEMKVDYKLENNGSVIMVPSEIKDSVRLQLAGENIPAGESGFELFQESSFGETQTDKKVKYQAALQGELARSIQSLERVKAAKVNLALPEESLFTDEEQKPTAAVVINTKDGEKLTSKEVQAITNLVANSVKNLKPDSVVIVDQNGNQVSDDPAGDTNAGDVVRMQLAMKREYEKEKEEAIQTMLDKVLGKDNSVVRVNAELDFDNREQVDEYYTHDPEGPFIVSENIIKDSGTQTETAQPGIPGTDNNIPQYEEVTTRGGSSSWDKSEKTINYNINRTEKVTRYSVGDVQYDYLTVSVFINRAGTKDANIGSTEEEKAEKVRGIVAAACGLRENRENENVNLQDNISIAYIDFPAQTESNTEAQETTPELGVTSYIPWLAASITVLLLIMVWLFIKRKKVNGEDYKPEESNFETIVTDNMKIADVIEQNISPEEKEKLKIKEKVDQIIEENPENAAQVIKIWLLEDMR